MTENTPQAALSDSSLTQEQLTALVEKHRTTIDPVLKMNDQQQKEVFREYGLDPDAISRHYDTLQAENVRLRNDYEVARKKAMVMGWSSFFAGMALSSIVAWQKKDKLSTSRPIRALLVLVASVLSGMGGNYVGWHAFGGRRVEGDAGRLVQTARDALENELAIAIENKGALPSAALPTPNPEAPPQTPTESRGASFADAITKEKAASRSAAPAFSL